MEEIITVDYDNETVSARDLHKALEIEKRFSTWFETNSQGFIENEDFSRAYLKVQANRYGGEQEIADYQISVDMAKHICLMSRTEKGKECRQYFLDLEKAWNTPEQIMSRALKVAQATIDNLHNKVLEMKPKADFFDAVADSKTAISIGDLAKVIGGIGRNKLFEVLRSKGILMQNNVPYQSYVDRGYFRVIEQKYTKPNGEIAINIKTLVYQRGVEYIRKTIEKQKPA